MLNKKIIICMFLLVFSILFANISYAIQQVTIENIKITDISGNQLYPREGISVITNIDGSPITYGQKFYVKFDAINTGNIPFSGTYFGIYPYNFEKKYLDLKIGAENKISMSIETSFLSTTCEGEKDLKIYISPWGTPIMYSLPMKIKYEGGLGCPFLTISSFNWLPTHPAYVNQSLISEERVIGAKFVVKNTRSSDFTGTYDLIITNIFGPNSEARSCSRMGEAITIPTGEELTIKLDPSPECFVGAAGYASLIIKDSSGNVMSFIQGTGTAANYIVDIPAWAVKSVNLDKLEYAPGELAKVYQTNVVFDSYSPLAKPIPAGSTYNLQIIDLATKEYISPDKNIVIEQELPLKKEFGTEDSNYYYLGPIEFNFKEDVPVPENIQLIISLKTPEGTPILTSSLGKYYNPYLKNIALKSIHACNTTNNQGCSCIASTKDDETYTKKYEVICNLQRIPSFTIAKEYGTRFIFDSRLEKHLENSYIATSLKPEQTISTLDFTKSIQFDSIPQIDSAVFTAYTFDFKCDADRDGHFAEFCEGGDDCDDNDNTIYTGAIEICDGKDNDCNAETLDGSGETWYNQPTTCGEGICSGNTGIYICENGIKKDTCNPLNGATEEKCGDETMSDKIDNDCDGLTDSEDLDCTNICDKDGDDYYSSSLIWYEKAYCFAVGYSFGDCNDNNPDINPGATEILCNGEDEDCNPDNNNGYDKDEDTYRTIDCSGAGIIDCNDDNKDINPGATEICNNLDDNCINGADEIFINKGDSCIVGQGICENIGIYVCKEDGTGTECNSIPGDPQEETCDGIDNNCVEGIDEGCSCVEGQTKTCYSGSLETLNIGICKEGLQTCSLSGIWGDCVGEVTPLLEKDYCTDGKDNDCDGTIDNLDDDCKVICTDLDKDGWNTTIGDICGEEIDCNDDNININPGMKELCGNLIDDNCDGLVDIFPEQKVNLPVYLEKSIDLTSATLNIICINKIGDVCKDPINTVALSLIDKDGNPISGVNVCVESCDTNVLPEGLLFWDLYKPTDEKGKAVFSYAIPKIGEYEVKFVTPSKYKPVEGTTEIQQVDSIIISSTVSISQKP
ncbi:MAG: MopE-related protein [Candidatus Nanoarchaeia archaeon]|nr:MopE-related protein [Candidatus Nanoarchaeia archaeon]MDD5588420.1 MopE-related protein [Candidatus Nanoarchaeia archaeon]